MSYFNKLAAAAGLATGFLAVYPLVDAPATAQEPKVYKLEGRFHLSARNCPDGAGQTCFYYVELDGWAAKQLYDSMRTRPQIDACTEGMMKSDEDGLHCFRSGSGGYGCYFGIDLVRRKLVGGDFSC